MRSPVYLPAEELAGLRQRVANLGRNPTPARPVARVTGSGLGQLTWRRGQGNGVEQAEAPGGKYVLTANMGRWDLCWKRAGGRIQSFLGGSLHRDEAEKIAQQDLLERVADAALKNAGHSALTTRSLKGPATKWRKRHG